jgi:hypothetical protein
MAKVMKRSGIFMRNLSRKTHATLTLTGLQRR